MEFNPGSGTSRSFEFRLLEFATAETLCFSRFSLDTTFFVPFGNLPSVVLLWYFYLYYFILLLIQVYAFDVLHQVLAACKPWFTGPDLW